MKTLFLKYPLLLVLIILLIGMGLGFAIGYQVGLESSQTTSINSFEECVAAGNPIMESYPEQCRTKDGRLFTNDKVVPPESPGRTIDKDQVFCTMDAKICPDGSSVGRVAPDCEFAACPGEGKR